jgi:hypothetical protein
MRQTEMDDDGVHNPRCAGRVASGGGGVFFIIRQVEKADGMGPLNAVIVVEAEMDEGLASRCAGREVKGVPRMGFERLADPGRVLAAPGALRCWLRWRRKDQSWLVAVVGGG